MAVNYNYILDGEKVSREVWLRARRRRGRNQGTPMTFQELRASQAVVSDSLAVHPKDAAQAEENARKAGFNVHFQPDGRPVFDSFSKMNAYAKHEGFHHLRKSHKMNY